MSDTFEETDETEQPSEDGLKDLRAAAKRSQQHADEALAAKRENAFLKAGVDTDTPLGKLAMTGYAGDLDTAQIKEFMASLGSAPTSESEDANPPISDDERQSTQIRQQLGSGAGAPSNEPPPANSPTQTGLDAFREARSQGASSEDASAFFFDNVFTAAKQGDARVLIQGSNNL